MRASLNRELILNVCMSERREQIMRPTRFLTNSSECGVLVICLGLTPVQDAGDEFTIAVNSYNIAI